MNSAVWSCARDEITMAVRSRLLVTFAIVFAALAILVAASGYVLTGGTGLQDFSRTSASLVELVLLIVPLAALVIGVTALTPEPGAAELLYSQPVARHSILAGKLVGLFLSLAAAEAIGFGASGLVLFGRTGESGALGFGGVFASALTLTAVFLSLAAAISAGATSRKRARALATALVIWFVAVVLFDIAALGLASWLPSGPAARVLVASVFANPVDAVRTATMLGLEGTTAFGGASLAFFRLTGGSAAAAILLVVSVLAWILLSLVVARVRLSRCDI